MNIGHFAKTSNDLEILIYFFYRASLAIQTPNWHSMQQGTVAIRIPTVLVLEWWQVVHEVG